MGYSVYVFTCTDTFIIISEFKFMSVYLCCFESSALLPSESIWASVVVRQRIAYIIMAEVYSVVALKQIVPIGLAVAVSEGIIQRCAYCFSRCITIYLLTQYITGSIIRVNVSAVSIRIILTRKLSEIIVGVAIGKAAVSVDMNEKVSESLSLATSEIFQSQRWLKICESNHRYSR